MHTLRHESLTWNWSRIWAIIIICLITLGLVYWVVLGIYIACDEETNMQPIVNGSLHIAVLVAMFISVDYLYDSPRAWWAFGFPRWYYVLLFWAGFTFLMFMDLFTMLQDILDARYNRKVNENLLISLSAIQLTFTSLALIWSIVVGIIILLKHGANAEESIVVSVPGPHSMMHSHPHSMSVKPTSTTTTIVTSGSQQNAGLATAYGSPSMTGSQLGYMQPGVRARGQQGSIPYSSYGVSSKGW